MASIKPIHVAGGFTVWRNGQEVTVQDGLIIRVDGLSRSKFIPGGISPPLFVLGDTVGQTLLTPYDNGQAVILVDSPPADTDIALWMTLPGETPEQLAGPGLKAQQSRALSAGAQSGINIRTPPASTPRTQYPTQLQLEDALVTPRVSPEICSGMGKQCGFLPQTTHGRLDCGPCPTDQICKTDNQCCTPSTCSTQGRTCGQASDGCGNAIDCGTCNPSQVCTAAGRCCLPRTCSVLGRVCGPVSDGCGGTLNCGTCATGQTCVSAGTCCTPKTCAELGKNCGSVSDGCGGTLNCGTCTAPGSCGGAGVPNVCGVCTPKPQSEVCAPRQCGNFSDGCSSTYNCGTCAAGQACAQRTGSCGIPDGGCGEGRILVCNDLGCRCEDGEGQSM
ncbi:hypothetical protein [Corallococcus llansteffanensis]|uniref:Uncharacterized protein n=1 Tax=Corallococcus llansteffanensis TaxID=2316731 RepID=A0A3A8PNU7_9BACT|nr:hypothetical protein [Corallococcus llansteffanensis]RKH56890.1 hypothetical protein D7V93_19350 [Corallococcus llansteffanensis]